MEQDPVNDREAALGGFGIGRNEGVFVGDNTSTPLDILVRLLVEDMAKKWHAEKKKNGDEARK